MCFLSRVVLRCFVVYSLVFWLWLCLRIFVFGMVLAIIGRGLGWHLLLDMDGIAGWRLGFIFVFWWLVAVRLGIFLI